MSTPPSSQWAIPDAITDPDWTSRPAPRRRRGHRRLLWAGLAAATAVAAIAAGAAVGLSRPAPRPAALAPAPAASSTPAAAAAPAWPSALATLTTTAPTRRPAGSHPARSSTSSTAARSTTAAAPPAATGVGGPGPTITVTSVAGPVVPTRPVSHQSAPAHTTAPPARTGAAPTPVPVTSTARQSIACPAGSQLDVTGSADRSGTLTLAGGGTTRSASGTHPAITVQVAADATFTASMTGINPHVAVSCQ